MRPHASAKTLARLQQGDLSPRRSSRIGAHLARCARCRALSEDLAGVTTLLASVHPPPIPEHLAARIQTALATEASRRGAPSRGAPSRGLLPDGQEAAAAAPGPGRPPRARLRPAVALRALAAAAAVVVVAGGVYEITQLGASSTSSSSASSPARRPLAPTAGGSAVNGSAAQAGPALPYRHAGGQDTVTPVMTGTDYQPEQLSSQVAAQLAKHGHIAAGAVPNAMSPPATRGPAAAQGGEQATFGPSSVLALAGCVNRIAAGQLVRFVDVARYQGAPATVIVTQASPGGPEQIWVVGAGCSASRSDVLRHAP